MVLTPCAEVPHGPTVNSVHRDYLWDILQSKLILKANKQKNLRLYKPTCSRLFTVSAVDGAIFLIYVIYLRSCVVLVAVIKTKYSAKISVEQEIRVVLSNLTPRCEQLRSAPQVHKPH